MMANMQMVVMILKILRWTMIFENEASKVKIL
jgi:hypothetical protein